MKKILALVFLISIGAQGRPVFATKGLVVSASDYASRAGIDIFKKGGNVVDAAVATEFVLAVTRPYYASLGGGGFLLLRLDGEVKVLDFREKAPAAATKDMFLKAGDNASTIGGLAVAIPGNVRGFFELHKKYGKLPWRDDIAPAVILAQKGFIVTEEFSRVVKENFSQFSGSGKEVFPLIKMKVGARIQQPKLANALIKIQKNGADGFYKGDVAQDIANSVKNQKGIMSIADLAGYKVRWLKPLKARVFGVDVWTMPPPSSGGVILLSSLKQAEKMSLNETPAYSLDEYFLLSEIMRRAFFDRQYIADPAFSKFNVEKLYSDQRIKEWTSTIDREKKSKIDKARFEIHEGDNTTHFIVTDSKGNCVSATVTVNTEFGSGVFSEKYGINLNNEMDDFTTRPGQGNAFGLVQSDLNSVAPGKTPLSSMTPTIVEKDSKFLMALGAPGGPRITTAVFQGLYHALKTKFTLEEIIQAPRVHHQWVPDIIQHDRTLSPTITDGLRARGFETKEGSTARLYMIRWDTNQDLLEGSFDYRGEGSAEGY